MASVNAALEPRHKNEAQYMSALAKANRVRFARARLKQKIKLDRSVAERSLADPPQYLMTMKVFKLLVAIPRYGPVRARQVLRACYISESKTVGAMSSRQRQVLVDYLRSERKGA